MSVEALLSACRKRAISKVAVTDHNSLQGALEARARPLNYVIVGEEIMTTEGEILGYFLTEEIPAGSAADGGGAKAARTRRFISVAHPFDRTAGLAGKKRPWKPWRPHLDGIECSIRAVLKARLTNNRLPSRKSSRSPDGRLRRPQHDRAWQSGSFSSGL
jgi:predicted metal-dependent phosphoesterase TrpH